MCVLADVITNDKYYRIRINTDDILGLNSCILLVTFCGMGGSFFLKKITNYPTLYLWFDVILHSMPIPYNLHDPYYIVLSNYKISNYFN